LLKNRFESLIREAALEAQQRGLCPAGALPEVMVEHPPDARLGDYACNLALKLARVAGTSPLSLAQALVKLLPPVAEVAKVEVAPPGFINFTLSEQWLQRQVEAIVADGEAYGNTGQGKGMRVQVEFVSANPTGPLHVGHGRGAVIGSALANVLSVAGYKVEREYYINDAGSQIEAFSESLYARYQQAFGMEAEMPASGYQGQYVKVVAEQIKAEKGRRFLDLARKEAVAELGELGLRLMLAAIRDDLSLLNVEYNNWFSEQDLYRGGQYEKAMEMLRQGGYVADKEGATWFASTALGENKDNVLVRSDGTPTYFAADVAYHYDKFAKRGFDRVIDIWGADHQGHVSRMRTAVEAMGIDPKHLTIIISQLVTLKRGEQAVRLSKRSGEIITLREVIEEVGPDACRFFFLSRSADSQMDFDLELAKKQSLDNPVYYVQYAHARIASILRFMEEKGGEYSEGDVSLLVAEPELSLIRKMIVLPEVIETVAATLEPHYLPYYAQELATVFHSFYMQCRVVTDDKALTAARLKLVKAARQVFSKTLRLMGMAAPDKM
jgi:arginyl-tRNA synthetase